MRKILGLLALVSCVFFASPAESFLDGDELRKLFKETTISKEVIEVNHKGSPIIVFGASVQDTGSARFKNYTGVFNTYIVNIKNTSSSKVLRCQLKWIIKLPFKNYAERVITITNIKSMKPGDQQSLKFRTDKYYREDAVYFVEIAKVEFDNGKIWEVDPSAYTIYGLIKQDIDSINSYDAEVLNEGQVKDLASKLGDNGVELESNGAVLQFYNGDEAVEKIKKKTK